MRGLQTPNFWDGGVEDDVTIEADVDGALWQMLVYGELFGRGLGRWLESLLARQGEGTEGLISSTSDGLNDRAEDISFDRIGTINTHIAHGHEPFVELALRCEYVKYAMIDRHVPLECHRGARPWGITTEWEYPASLLSDSGESEVEGGSAGATHLDSERAEVQPEEEDNVSTWDVDGMLWGEPDQNDPTARLPCVLKPTNHLIRLVKLEGQYNPALDIDSEQSMALVHLFKYSPLWAKITKPLRHRAIRLAKAPRSPRGDGPTSASMSPSTEAVLDKGAKEDTSSGHEGEVEEFGKTVASMPWTKETGWKQQIWEDGLWTAGWDGLEVIADAWEYSEENHKAIARRDARGVALAPQSEPLGAPQSTSSDGDYDGTAPISGASAGCTSVHSHPELDCRVADDHPGLQRLIATYAQLQRLHERPPGIEFRSILHPDDEIFGSEGPLIVSDMALMIWEPGWH